MKKNYLVITERLYIFHQLLRKMARRQERFCGDTLNTFAREDPKNHWSRAYKYYFSLSPEEKNCNDVYVFGIAKERYVPEVFYAKELLIWCINNFEKDQRIIKLNRWSLISLAATNFSQMLKLLKPTTAFKVEQAKDFIKAKNNDKYLLPQCLEDPTTVLQDLSMIQVNLFKTPYKEMAWLLARVLGHESIAIVSHLALYVLYNSIQWNIFIDWSIIISSEISFQLSNFNKDKKLICLRT
jgi:hypothetical protein